MIRHMQWCFILGILMTQNLWACKKPITTFSRDDTPIYEIVHQISNLCQVSLLVEDANTLEALKKPFKTLYLNKASYKNAIKVLLDEDFYYKLNNGVLHIAYLKEEVVKINYLSMIREAKGLTALSLDTSATTGSTNSKNTAKGNSGITINIQNAFDFWNDLDRQIKAILEPYEQSLDKLQTATTQIIIDPLNPTKPKTQKATYSRQGMRSSVVVDSKTGSIYLRASKKQLRAVKAYLKAVQENLSKQVLVDVNIYKVSLTKSHQTGIDWQQISNLQNFKAGIKLKGDPTLPTSTNTNEDGTTSITRPFTREVSFSKDIEIDSLLAFIKTHGNTTSVSNPRILAINNQTAIISIGKQIYYKIISTTNTATTSQTTSESNENIESVFSGLVVDITPSISKAGEVILHINNSLTSLVQDNNAKPNTTQLIRNMPPDLDKQEISTVIKAKDGQKIILGGLISDRQLDSNAGVKGLGKIPILGFFFGQDTISNQKEELVIVITPQLVSL